MKKIFIITPWVADIGHGIILTIIMLKIFDLEPRFIYFIFGFFFSVAPDLDAIKELIKFKNVAASKGRTEDHRDGLHYPVLWIIFGALLIWHDNFIGTFFLSGVLLHFINDSWGTGWGVQWLWPLSKRSYKFFSRPDKDADVTLSNLLVSWDSDQKKVMMEQFGNPNFIQDIYLRPTKISIIEYGIFIFSIVLLIIYLITL